MTFYQVPPVLKNPWEGDRVLRSYLKRNLPTGIYSEIESDLKRLAERVVNELEPLAQEAENHPPVHVPYGPWGKRIDEIKVSAAWNRLHEIAAEEGIVATGYERKHGEYSRLHQFAKLYLYHPSSAIYSCPLAMTDGAARLIELFGNKEMKERAFKFLTSRDPEKFWTSGQWMTERTGGSDVSGTATVAKPEGEHFSLYGVKWFTSATTSQMAMTLARIEGDEKLSLFYLELRDKDGNLQNIQINRLKDKMGTKALPTAELTLNGTPAVLVGERGKGVKTISTLFNITRLYNACCAVGYMQRGITLLKDYSSKRVAFGKPIIEHGLHAETLADLQVRFEASFLMTFHASLLLGKEETGKASEVESGTLRLLIPLVKLYTAKEGVAIATEVIESFGGAGYIEDTGLPQILRNAQVLAIWEGTTNVLSLDALRAIKKENAGEFFLKDLQGRLSEIKHPELAPSLKTISEAIKKVTESLMKKSSEEDISTEARVLSLNLSRIYCSSLMIQNAERGLAQNDRTGVIALQRFLQRGIYQELISDEQRRKDSLELLK
jgi:putative acyl-CoA dehydrogenase